MSEPPMIRTGSPCKSLTFLLVVHLCVLAPAGAATQDDRPRAGIGPEQRVAGGAKVLLTGSGRVETGRIVRFRWTQTAGPRVALRKANRSTAHFMAPPVKTTTTLEFRLTVTDSYGRKGSRMTTVTVVPEGEIKPPAPTSAGPSQ